MAGHADDLPRRGLGLRLRPDLEVQRPAVPGGAVVVKDPLRLKYYRFPAEEFAILELLDGTRNLEQIQQAFATAFAPQTITLHELHRLLGRLHGDGLLLADAPGQGSELWRRRAARRRDAWQRALTNVLAIRLRGWDPDRFLTGLSRWCGWLFSPAACVIGLLLAVSAVLLMVGQAHEVQARWPTFAEFFAARNWLWLAATLAATKVLHELAHGLACKRWGGECHEMGVLLLVLTPCLYCNVSDAWRLPSKWQRLAIAAAGVYAEVVLAAACAWIWWFTAPGLWHYLCLDVMVVCSVSTLVFNANPLARYDGYYALSDLLGIPNLRPRSAAFLRQQLGHWLLGLTPPPGVRLARRRQALLLAYAIASAVYAGGVLISVFWFLDQLGTPYRLRLLVQMLAVAAAWGLFGAPAWRWGKSLLEVPGVWDRVNRRRLAGLAAAGSGLLLALFLVPWPYTLSCAVTVQPQQAATVYVEVPGSLAAIHVRAGQSVAAGQPLLTLENWDVRQSVVRLDGERNRLLARLDGLRQCRLRGDAAAGQAIGLTHQALAAIEEQWEERQRELARLSLSAPCAGVVLPAARVPPPAAATGQLPLWAGRPLDRHNLGARLTAETVVCHVADPRYLEATLSIDETQWEFVRPGQPVQLFLDQMPGRPIATRIAALSVGGQRAAAGGTAFPSVAPPARSAGPASVAASPVYQARCVFADPPQPLVLTAHGRARVSAGYQTLAQRLWRYAVCTFR